ncbi:MAG: response regulator [Acidimicrobiia bacterium]
MTIRIVVCDDQDLVRDGLQAILSTAPGMEIVGEAADGETALELVEKLSPDVVLMDLRMPGMNGITATRKITNRFDGVKVLVLTTYDAPEWVEDAITAGAAGYLLKDSPRARLIDAIKGTAAGRTHVDPGVAGQLFDRVTRTPRAPGDTTIVADLSERELEVLQALGGGLTNTEIAERLYLSEGTIRNYVSSILSKLEVSDRTQAAVLAIRHGIVDSV